MRSVNLDLAVAFPSVGRMRESDKSSRLVLTPFFPPSPQSNSKQGVLVVHKPVGLIAQGGGEAEGIVSKSLLASLHSYSIDMLSRRRMLFFPGTRRLTSTLTSSRTDLVSNPKPILAPLPRASTAFGPCTGLTRTSRVHSSSR